MYKAYLDGTPLYDPANGYNLESPKVQQELNKVGSFDFTIRPNHPSYGLVKKLSSVVTVYDEQQLVFRGRVLNDEEGFHNEKKVECESDLAFLLDSVVRPYDYSGSLSGLFSKYVTEHNAQVEGGKQFAVGNITVTDNNDYVHYSSTQYPTTWDEINDKLIKTHGGYLMTRYVGDTVYLDYVDDFSLLSNQPIEFGRNLVDFTRKVKGEDVATAIIPLGAKLEDSGDADEERRLTIASVNGGKDYLYDAEAVEKYGWIFCTETWDDVTEASNLKSKGQAKLSEKVLLGNSLDLSAVDLSALDSDFSAFHLGTYVHCKSEPHNVDANFLVSKLNIELSKPESNKLTLGSTYASLTDNIHQQGQSINNWQSSQEQLNNPVTGFTLQYYSSTSPTELAGDEWTDADAPTWQQGRYVWSRTKTTYLDGTVVYGTPVCITGNTGDLGDPGASGDDGEDGVSVTDITPQYYLSTSKAAQVGGSWTTTPPTWIYGHYLWTRSIIKYSDGRTEYTTPVVDSSWEAVNEIEFGGRNLLRDTAYKGDSGYSVRGSVYSAEIDDSDDGLYNGRPSLKVTGTAAAASGTNDVWQLLWDNHMITGKPVMLSFYAKGSVATGMWHRIGGASIVPGSSSATSSAASSITTSWKRYEVNLGNANSDNSNTATAELIYGFGAAGTFWINSLKVEYGNKATDWTPAPEDQQEDINQAVVEVTQQYQSYVDQRDNSLRTYVGNNYYLKDDADQLVSSINTKFEQTEDSFTYTFQNLQKDLTDLANGVDANFMDIRKYIRFVDGNIVLGIEGNELTLRIQNDRISFLQDNLEVAYFSDKKLYVTDAEILNQLALGNFAFFPRSNGSLTFRKIS